MIRSQAWFWLVLLLVTGLHRVEAQQYLSEEGKAVFTSETPLTTFSGESSKLAGFVDLKENLVDFYLDLNTLDTGIGLRDKHMRKNYLETDKYPFAEFTGRLKEVPEDLQKLQEVEVIGLFKIHGVEREVSIQGLMINEAGGIRIQAEWDLLLSDYNIEIPKVAFYQLSERQVIAIDILLKAKNE
jgi:polyisoprenoid-binding protein YceI